MQQQVNKYLFANYSFFKQKFMFIFIFNIVAHGCYYFSTKTVMKDFMSNLDQIALVFSGIFNTVFFLGNYFILRFVP